MSSKRWNILGKSPSKNTNTTNNINKDSSLKPEAAANNNGKRWSIDILRSGGKDKTTATSAKSESGSAKSLSSSSDNISSSSKQRDLAPLNDLAPPNPAEGVNNQRNRSQSSFSQLSHESIVSSKGGASSMLSINTSADFLVMTKDRLRLQSPVTPKKLNTLHKAVYTNDVERVRKLMAQKDRDPNKVDSFHGCTALHIAAEFNKLDVVKLLLDPEKMGPAGTWATPIDRRADPSLKNLEGKTPFLMAAKAGHLEMITVLLEYHSNVNTLDSNGCSALHYAILAEERLLFDLLLERGISIKTVDKSGDTLLHHAVRLERVGMAQTIIEKGHEVNIFNQEKRTPLHMAMGTFSEPMIRLLLSYGARIDAEDSQSKRPMDYVNEGMSGDILYEITSSVVADSEIRDAIQRDDDADRATLQSVGKTARMGLIADPSHEQLNPLAPSTSGDSSLFKLAESRPYFVGLNDQNRQKASTTNIAAPSSYSGHHHSEETSGLNVTSIIQTGDEASSDAESPINLSESVDEASEMYEENQDQMEEEYDDQVEDDDDDIEDEEIVSGTIATNSNLSHAPQSAARIDETLPAQQKDQRETDSELSLSENVDTLSSSPEEVISKSNERESEFRKTSVSSEGVGQQDIEDGSSSSNPLSFSEDEEGYTKKINMDQYLDHGSSSEIRESLVVEVNKKSAKVDRQRYKEETEDQVELQEEENLDDDDEEEEGDGDLFNSHSLDDVVVQAPQITLVKETTEIKAPAIETENGDFDEMWREDTFKFWYDNPAGGNSNQLQSKASISSSVKSETKSTSNKLVTAASEKATTIVDHIDYMDNTTSTTEIKPAIRTPSSSSIGRSPERRGSSRLASKPLPNPPSLVASATAATETKTSAPQSIASSRNPSSEILKASSDKTSSISNRLNMLDEIRQLATSNRGSVLEFKIQRIEKFLSSAILELKQKDYMENALKEMMGSANSDNTNESIMSPEELVGSISEFFQKSKMESLSLKSESARLKEIIALEQEEKINKLGLSEASFSAITSPPTSSYNAEELDHLKSNIKRLCSEKEDLETRLEQSALSNKNLTSIYDSTSKKIKDLEDQVSSIKQDSATALDRANSSIQLLSSEKASLESRLERSEATNQDLALSLEKSLSSSNESNTSAGDERLNHANSTIQKLAAEKSRLESQLENQVKQAKISKSENDMSCEVMIKKIKDLEILNLQARERITELENRLHNNEQQFEVSKSQSELRSPQSPTKLENSALHNQVAHLNEEISSLKSSKQAEVRLLKAELEIITAEKMKLIEQIAALNERLTNKAEFSDEILARDQAKMLKARQVDKDKIVWLEAELAKIEAELKAAKLQEIETGCKLEEEKLKGKHMSTKCAIFVREIKFRRALNRGVSERATELTASDENLALGQELEYYGVLEKESISLKQDLEHVTAELKSSEDALRVATDQLNMTNLEAQNSLQHSSLKSQGLEKLIYENRVNIQDQAEQIKRKDERIKEFETVIQSKLQEIKNQAESMQVLNDQNGKLQRMHDSMAEKSDALEKELESKTGLIKSLQTQVKDLKLNILEINTTNIINKTGSLEHQDAIKYYENEIKIVTAQLEEERQLRSNIEAEHNKVLESLSSFEENFTVLRQLHERDVEYTRELEGEKERLESRIERQLAEMEESKRILQKQYNSIQDTTRRLMETESELNKKTLDLSKSESALNAKQMEADEFRTLSKNIQQKLERTNDILAEISTKSEASAKATESELSRKNSELKIALDENIKYADIARREAAVMDDLVLEIQEVVGDFALQIAKSGTEPPPPPERRSSKTNVMPTQQQQHHHAGHMHPGNLSDKIALIQLEASKIRRLCSTAEKIMRENELDAEKRLSSAKHEKELSSIQLGNEIQIRDELISSLKMQMSELASEFQVVQERLKDDKVEHHQAQIAELDQARRDCDQLVSQKQKLEVALQDVIKNHSESRSNLDFELNQLRAQLNQTSDSLANEKITNGEQIKDLSVKNKELLEDKSVLSERVEHLLLELEAAKLEHRRLESISRESEAQARAKIDELTGKIDAANAQIRQEQQRLSTISSTDSRFKNAISNLSSALNELRGTTRKTVLSNPVLSFKISSQEDFSGLSNTSSSFREAIGIVSAQSELKLSSIEDDLKKEIAKLTELQSNNLNELSDDIVNQLITVSRQKSLDSKQIIFSLKSFLMDSLNQLGEDLDNCVGNLIKKIERQSGKLVNAEKNYSDVSEENIQLKNIVRKMKASGGLVTSSPSSSTTPATKNNDHVIAGDDSMSSSNNAAVLMVPISTSSKFGFASVSEDLHLEKVSSLEQKCRKLQDELQSTRRRLEEEQVLRREASKKLQDIEMETSARHDSMVSQYDNRVSASLATIRDLQEKLVHTEKLLNFHRLESVKNESSFTMERQDLVGRIEVLKENCAQLNRAVDAATAKITVQHQKIGELQSLLISNEGKDSDIKGELENVKSTLSSTTRSFEARRRSDQDKINSLSNMLSEARLELLNKGNSFDSEKLLKSFQDEVQMKQDQLSKLRKEIDDLHSSRRDLDSRRHDAESQLSRTLTQKYDLEKELDTLTFEKSAWVAEKAHLIQRLEWLGNQAALHKQHQAENAENMEKMYSELDSALKGVVTDNNNRIFAAATSSPSASMSPQHTQSASISANLNSSHPPFTLNIPSSNSDQFYLHRFMMKLAEIISAQKQSTDIKFGQLEKNLKEIKNYLTSSRSPSLDSFDVSSMQQAASTVSDEKGAEETSATSAQGYIPRHLLHFSPALDRRATRKAEKITSEVFRQALEEAESKIVSLERERIVQKNDIERLLKKTDYIKKKYKAASEARIRKILTAMEIQSRERDNVQLHNKLNQDDLKDMYESQISDLVSELKLAKSVIIKEKMATASVAAAAAAAVASTPTTSNNTPIFPNLFSATTMTPGGKSPLIDIDLQVEKIISVASGTNSKRRYSFMP